MKSRRNYYIGVTLIIIGIAIFIFYYMTKVVSFHTFDEVTQVEGTKIISYDDYLSSVKHEFILISLSILTFFSGMVMLFINNVNLKKN